MDNLSPDLLAYLQKWHNTTVTRKAEAGHQVDLPFPDFVSLFKPKQIKSLQNAIAEDRLHYFQREDNEFALVASWRSYAAVSSGIYNKDTAIICSRMKSAQINLPAPGDKLRPSHRAKIGDAKRGVPQSPEHREALSVALTGQPKKPWTEQRKADRRADIAARKEKKK